MDEARPRDEKGERERRAGQSGKRKRTLPSRLEERRGSFVLPSSTRAGIPGEYIEGMGDTSVWKSAHPARLGGAFPFGGERGNGKEWGALSRSISLS